MASGRVVVVGSINMDHTINVSKLPVAGSTVLGTGYAVAAGGKGANQAVTAARLGAPTSMVAALGNDSTGADLARLLEQEGVDLTHVRRLDGAATGVALITVDEVGDNTIVVAPLANAELEADQVDDAVEVIASSAVLLTQLEVPLAAVARALEVARGAGVTTLLNPAPATMATRLASILPLVDVVVPNQSEAARLSGRDDPVEAARWLVSMGPRSAVVTLGDEGAVWFDGALVRRVRPFPSHVVDPTAAGDAFCGALAAALADGRGMAEGLDWASAAGAHAVSIAGAIPSLPTRSDVSALLAARRSAGG